MGSTYRLEQVGRVPEDATVCDYDELSDGVKQDVSAIAAGHETDVSVETTADQFVGECQFVKFTEYYRVDPT